MGRQRSTYSNPKIAVACLRVSTDKERQALGIEAQRSVLSSWAAREGVTIATWHIDEISGGAPINKRPGLLAALADLRVHRAGLLAFQKVDRFTRDATAAALVGLELKRLGAEVVFAGGNGSGDDPTSKLLRSVLVAVAEFERAMISARILTALNVKRTRGEMTGKTRYGFRRANDGIHLVKDPAEQRVVAKVLSLRKRGLSIRAIAV